MTPILNRTAIVTGASRGIGAAVAQRLAEDGFKVVINFAGNAQEAAALVDKIQSAGGQARAAQADVSDPAAVRAMFDKAESAYGGVDVLVNNAGIMQLATIADATDELFDHFAKLAPLERLGTPQDVANTVAFLAGPDGGWINGQVLRANGGVI